MTIDHQSVQRSLNAMTLGIVRDMRSKTERSARSRLGEGFQHIQIPVSGTAEQGIAWTKHEVEFDYVMYPAKSQRDSTYDRPQFKYGYVTDPVDQLSNVSPIIVTAVCEFVVDENEGTTGAKIHIGVHSPTAQAQPFSGSLHCSFQGWGAIREDSSDPE